MPGSRAAERAGRRFLLAGTLALAWGSAAADTGASAGGAAVGAGEAVFCEGVDPVSIDPGARVGEVVVNVGNVFDTSIAAEDLALYRLANALHIKTHGEVVESRLLLHEGDPFSERKARESERLLRDARYLYDPTVCVRDFQAGQVSLEVDARDVWTLSPSVHFGHAGGKSRGGFAVEDLNLLGRGVELGLGQTYGVDRDSTFLRFHDANLLGSWVRGGVSLLSSSDGHTVDLRLDQPFYSLDARRAASANYLDDVYIGSLYDQGEVINEFRATHSYQRLGMGLSDGLRDGWVRRWSLGLVRDVNRFSPTGDPELSRLIPEDRALQYPFLGFEAIQDHYRTAHNHGQIARTEDLFMGWRLQAELGVLNTGLGSDRSGLVMNARVETGGQATDELDWSAEAGFGGRALARGGLEDGLLDGRLSYYWRETPWALLYVSGRAAIAHDADLDHQLLIGGDNGLRGYPLRYQSGEALALLTVEQRFFTDWYPFRLFHVGATAFVDVGRTWGESPLAAESLGLLRDVGVGLRLGGSRSGTGKMIHIDLAMPLDGGDDISSLQFVVEATHGF